MLFVFCWQRCPAIFFRFQHQVKSLKPDEFVCDIHVPELLVFAAGTDLHEHELCTNGSIILQDKVVLKLIYSVFLYYVEIAVLWSPAFDVCKLAHKEVDYFILLPTTFVLCTTQVHTHDENFCNISAVSKTSVKMLFSMSTFCCNNWSQSFLLLLSVSQIRQTWHI